jgi:hypothetical protein
MSKSKKRVLPPRRKRRKRPARLQSARTWLATYEGKNVVRGYAKWFAVDLWCAVLELRMLGVEIDPEYAEAIRTRRRKRKPVEPPRDELPEGYGIEWDENFSYIAGYTSGGAPFGTPWEP